MGPFYDAQSRPGAWPGGLQACCQRGRSEHTDCLTKMRPSRARPSGPEASYHILYSVACITTTCGSEFLVHTNSVASNRPVQACGRMPLPADYLDAHRRRSRVSTGPFQQVT